MHYVRAAVVLLAAMTFSLTALGQTRSAIFIFTPPSSAVVPFAGLPPCPGSYPAYYCTPTPIVRYTNTALFGTTEYTETVDPDTGLLDCQYLDYGTWTVTSTVLPKASVGPYAGQYAGVASQGTPFAGPPPTPANGGPCTGTVGSATYMYLPIDFNWQLERNDTAVPNYGPSATFTAQWTGEILCTSGCSTNFVVTVPVVRPTGETSTFLFWQNSYGKWQVTLQPPDDDPTFDFTGEKVNEVYLNDQNSCPVDVPHAPSSTVVGLGRFASAGAPGSFGDSVGWDPCIVEYVRCVKRTPCGFGIQQQMQIMSPADTTFTNYGSAPNYLSSVIYGNIYVNLAGKLSVRNGIGNVTSQRSTPLSSGPNNRQVQQFPSDKLSCFSSLVGFQLYLKLLGSSC